MREVSFTTISALLGALIVVPVLIYKIESFYKKWEFNLLARNALQPEIEALKNKYNLQSPIREKTLNILQGNCTYWERFDLLKIIFYYTEYFQYSQTLLYKFFQKFFFAFNKSMEWFSWNNRSDPISTPLSPIQVLLFILPVVLVTLWSLFWEFYFLMQIVLIFVLGAVILWLLSLIFWFLSSILDWQKPDIDELMYLSFKIYEHIVQVRSQKDSLTSLNSLNYSNIDYATQLQDRVQQLSKQLMQLQKDWQFFVRFSPIKWYQKPFLKVENKIPEKEFQKEIQNFISDTINSFELLIQAKLGLLTDGVNASKSDLTELQATTTEFSANGILELQKQRLTVLEESIVKVTVRDVL